MVTGWPLSVTVAVSGGLATGLLPWAKLATVSARVQAKIAVERRDLRGKVCSFLLWLRCSTETEGYVNSPPARGDDSTDGMMAAKFEPLNEEAADGVQGSSGWIDRDGCSDCGL